MPPLSCTRHVLSRLCGSLLASQSVPIKTSSSLGCGRLCGDDRRYGGDISSRPCVRRDACCSGERHRPSGRWAEGTSSRPFAASASALAAVIVVGQLIGRLFAIVGQPPVIGEVLAGILLGSSLLGPRISAFVLPPEIAPYLQVISQLGVILYMFMVGLDLNAGLIKGRCAYAGYVACQYSSSLSFRIGRRAGSLSKAFQPRRTVHQLRFVSGGWDVDYGLPRACADSDRPRYEPNRIGSHCFKLCGDRPRDRLVPVGLRRRHRKSASRILMALVTTMNTGPAPCTSCFPRMPPQGPRRSLVETLFGLPYDADPARRVAKTAASRSRSQSPVASTDR